MSKPPPRNASRPEPGLYTVRLRSRGWPVPACVHVLDGCYVFEVDGTAYPLMTPDDLDERVAGWLTGDRYDPITQLLIHGQPCTEAVYAHRNAIRDWAQIHSPGHPSVNPTQPINTRLLRSEDF
jgi:hypothetical protein